MWPDVLLDLYHPVLTVYNELSKLSTRSNDYDHLCKKRQMEPNDRKRQAIEVFDEILTEISDRFKFTGHLGAAALFQPDKFPEYNRTYPEHHVKVAVQTYTFLPCRHTHFWNKGN
ncbi:hypothetical protein C0J52_28239 [Blattella germanica]|nr:hypothetical protein C0J52_28239 [Blattella germanica]